MARMAYVELGIIQSPGKDLDVGVARNIGDGGATQATAGVTFRFR